MDSFDKPIVNAAALKARALEQRHALAASLTQARAEGRANATPMELAQMESIRALDAAAADAESEAARSGANNPKLSALRAESSKNMSSGLSSISEPRTYSKANSTSRSYVLDLVKTSMNMDSDGEARARLAAHAVDVATAPEYRDLSRVEGQGGYAVPPAWLVDSYIEYARPGRAFANLVTNLPLPGGTDSINIPKMKTGTAVDVQVADNTKIAEVDLTDDFVNAPVRTLAGEQSLAIQLLDQSPVAFDQIVFRDLVAAHAGKVDTQVLNGTGAAGQILGVYSTPGIQTVVPTAATVKGVYSAIANAVQLIHSNRFLPPEVIVMHPRRWGWFLAQTDTQDRPLFLPAANSPQNAQGILTAVASQQVVGQMHGLPVVTDPNMPTNLGGSGGTPGTQDNILVLRASDLVLYEGGVRTRVLPEPKASNLTVLLQVFNYLAFSAARFPQSTVIIGGLPAPSF